MATNAQAFAKRSLGGRPIQPHKLGAKRAKEIISKVATSRLAEPLIPQVPLPNWGKGGLARQVRIAEFAGAAGFGYLVDNITNLATPE